MLFEPNSYRYMFQRTHIYQNYTILLYRLLTYGTLRVRVRVRVRGSVRVRVRVRGSVRVRVIRGHSHSQESPTNIPYYSTA